MAAPSKKMQKKKIPRDGPKLDKSSKKDFKTKRKSNDAVQSKAAALQLAAEDDVPDFPRGKRGLLSRSEQDEVRAEVDAEFAGEELKDRRKKKTAKKNHVMEDDLGSLFEDGITGKLPRFANRITLQT